MWQVLFPSLVSILGKLIPDPEQRAAAQLTLIELHQAVGLSELQAAVSVMTAEAAGNWLQRSWRPLMMLTFTALILARCLGWTAPNLQPAEYNHLWNIVQLGIGGYVIGRSAEKVAPAIADAIKGAVMNAGDLLSILQVVGPAVAVYVAIRTDIAAMHVRLDHLDRDLYRRRPDVHQKEKA